MFSAMTQRKIQGGKALPEAGNKKQEAGTQAGSIDEGASLQRVLFLFLVFFLNGECRGDYQSPAKTISNRRLHCASDLCDLP